MMGETHKKFGAIFSGGVTLTYLTKHPEILGEGISNTVSTAMAGQGNFLDILETGSVLLVPTVLMGFFGYISASWADADIYTSGKKEFTAHTRFDMVIWAGIFKVLGLKDHRDFQSHSPVLWIPVWALLVRLFTLINPIMGLVVGGFALGYCSHIIADGFTTDGIKLFPDYNNKSFLWKVFKHHPRIHKFLKKLDKIKFRPMGAKINHHGIFKASHKWWNYLFLILSLDIFLAFLSWDIFLAVNRFLFGWFFQALWAWLLSILNSMKSFFTETVFPFVQEALRNLISAN